MPTRVKLVKANPPTITDKTRKGRKRRLIVEFPPSSTEAWDDPETFHDALSLHIRRHGDSSRHLHRVIVGRGEIFDLKTLYYWRKGLKSPSSVASFRILRLIEHRYRLVAGYFKAKLCSPAHAPQGHNIPGVAPAERRRLAWHLPDNFEERPRAEREEILQWVRTVVISGSTDYRRYQAAAMKHPYAVRFPELKPEASSAVSNCLIIDDAEEDAVSLLLDDPELVSGVADAPPALVKEMADLIKFKTATLTTVGFQRNGVWGEETTAQKIEHLGLMFGALAASPRGAVKGAGVPLGSLSFSLLVLPAIWDWYLQWREQRRGFYTVWEVDMLTVGQSFTRQETGWLRQNSGLANRLGVIPGLVSATDVETVRRDWEKACDEFHKYASARVKEVQRVARVHRDPFEPILPVLESTSPLSEYRKIADEILRTLPDEKRYPKAAAEAVRSYLMIRVGLHTGLRQKNLRQLMFRARGELPTPERQLADAKRGELRWNERDSGWEVFIPAVAFKNVNSSYFGNKPFRLLLPDLANLYRFIGDYIDRHRSNLLRGARDPGTFFVKTVKLTSADAAYNQTSFYSAWRLTIQRFGIYNPYTDRGAIKGLLPHGPHNLRDVLATHILKLTGSYEQASYAIQDTPDMVAKHYGRFLPQDKAALAAKVLNKVWEAA